MGKRQETVLISRQERSLHRVTLIGPGQLQSIAPPVCGTCQHYQAGLCREHRVNAKAADVSCTSHRWQRGHERLQELVDALRLEPGRRWIIEAMQKEFGEGEAKELAYLEAIEGGDRPPVGLRTTEPAPFVPGTVHTFGLGSKISIDWVDAENTMAPPSVARKALVSAAPE